MYKDKDRQKQAQREASKRYRAKNRAHRMKFTPAEPVIEDERDLDSMTQVGMISEGMTVTRTASLQDYLDNPDDYAKRTNPERLNWGPYMASSELRARGYVANRVPISGDWDYITPQHQPAKYKGRASNSDTQVIWDKHAAQGRPTVGVLQ